MKASTGQRIGAFALDFLFSLPLALIWMIPFIGTIVGGFGLFLYWLLRDILRPSLGKKISGTVVVSRDGSPASTGQLILRNLPLALPELILMIPILGFTIGIASNSFILLLEFVLLAATGQRLGDRLAGTEVHRAILKP